jgi:hypothetical protein
VRPVHLVTPASEGSQESGLVSENVVSDAAPPLRFAAGFFAAFAVPDFFAATAVFFEVPDFAAGFFAAVFAFEVFAFRAACLVAMNPPPLRPIGRSEETGSIPAAQG